MTTVYSPHDLDKLKTHDVYGLTSECVSRESDSLSVLAVDSELVIAKEKIQELEKTVSNLKDNIETIKKDSYLQGKLFAQTELENKYSSSVIKEKELMAQLCFLSQLTETINSSIDSILDDFRCECYEIVFSAVLAIIGYNCSDADHRVTSLIESHLDKIKSSKSTVLSVSPMDYRVLVENLELMSLLPKQVRVEELTQLGPGDILIKSADGELDYRLQVKIEQFKSLIVEHALE